MNDAYLCEKLKGYSELLYGKKDKCFAKKVGNLYYFGYKTKKKSIKNCVTKEFAMYICVNTIPAQKKPEVTEEDVLSAFKKYLKKQTPLRREKVLHKFSKFCKKNKK